ncbi:MAG: hypothetical protein V5A27_07630 [Halapricum sp.]
MGGLGSGRREYATTPTVGECHTLPIDVLTEAVKHPGAFVPYRWRDEHGHGDVVASIGIYPEREGRPAFDGGPDEREAVAEALADRATHLRLEATVTPPGGESKDVEYRVELEYTPCHFGGVRPWFRCPATGCGDRIGKLYRPPRAEVFACRECYDLGYRSSRTSGDALKQAELRYRRAFAKADAKDRRPHPNSHEPPYVPERAKGMHGEAYADLLAEVHAAREEWDEAFQVREREMMERLRGMMEGF